MIEFDTERDPLDMLAEEFAQRWRRGEKPSIGDYAARFPQWASEIRAVLPSVAKMEQWRTCREATDASLAPGASPEKVGDYRILREVGRGGMGIVFEAIQESLGRRVALKILPNHFLLDRKRLERFQRESRAAARLHHTNIVQVFGVGEQDGFHYYVMQFIEGRGLNEVLRDWRCAAGLPDRTAATDTAEPDRDGTPVVEAKPMPRCIDESRWRETAAIGMQVADGLHHAHQQGIVHRDLKPANILLQVANRESQMDRAAPLDSSCKTSSLQSAVPKITDFGLAKLSDHDDLTQTGDILGTVGYMAPECFHGYADARSDICALGLTLYEMLTLQPPYAGTSPARLIRQASEQEPIRPRKLNPAIPRDLETIILKAISREPERRYATALALAEDLGRFLDDRPILARRTTAPERLWRWCRRNRALATLAGIALACFLLAAVVGWVGYVHTRRALDGESQKSAEAKQATELAMANVKLSLEHFEEIFDRLADKASAPPREGKFGFKGVKTSKVSEEDAALLNSIVTFYDEFTERNTTNPRLQLEAAKAQRRAGDIHRRLHQPDKAAVAYQRAVAMLEKLAEKFPAEPRYRSELMLTYLLEDMPASDPEQLRAAEQRLARAVIVAGRLVADDPESVAYSCLEARCQARLGVIQHQRGHMKEAEGSLRKALAIQKAVKKPTRDPDFTQDLASARLALAECLLAKGELAEARATLEDSIKSLRSSTKDEPRYRWRGGQLASHYQKLAAVLTRLGMTELAEEATRSAGRYRQSFRGRP
ncbi:MAG: serine/threonine protein kinase [Planctomycetes bacterium]|nr:serine/threonine protein kinase [Planctomycetota bacterium]